MTIAEFRKQFLDLVNRNEIFHATDLLHNFVTDENYEEVKRYVDVLFDEVGVNESKMVIMKDIDCFAIGSYCGNGCSTTSDSDYNDRFYSNNKMFK